MISKIIANFCLDEKVHLIEIIQTLNVTSILEDKSKDRNSLLKKVDAWKAIENKFNGTTEEFPCRCIKTLQTPWQNIKSQSKKDHVQQRRSLYLTVCGSSIPLMDKVSEAAISFLSLIHI